MSERVYSVQLLQDHSISGDRTITCEDGYTTVLRQISWFSQAPVDADSYQYAYGPAGGTFLWFHTDIDTTIMQLWEGRWVFNEGDVVTFHSDQETDLLVCGYRLLLP